MFIIKKELAKARRKLIEYEERQSRKESMESNESLHEESPKIVSSEEGGGVRGDDGGEDGEEEGEKDGLLLQYDCGPEMMVLEDEESAERLQVKSPDHVTREEAEVQYIMQCCIVTVDCHRNFHFTASIEKTWRVLSS